MRSPKVLVVFGTPPFVRHGGCIPGWRIVSPPRRLSAVASFLVLVSGSLATDCSWPRRDVAIVDAFPVDLCYARVEDRELVKAESYAHQGLRDNPLDARAHDCFGLVEFHREKLDSAAEQFRKAIAIKPDMAAAHNNLGAVLLRLRDHEGASKEFREAIKIDNGYTIAHRNLGASLVELGDFDSAHAEFEVCMKLDPKDEDCRAAFLAGLTEAEREKFLEGEKKNSATAPPETVPSTLGRGE